MGIAEPAFSYMVRSIPPLRLGPACATLGKQHIFMPVERALEIAAHAGLIARGESGSYSFPEQHPFVETHRKGRAQAQPGTISDVALMNLLGFEKLVSIDASSFEGADAVLDLNNAEAAAAMGTQFDFVLDGGTIEHVFHVPNALKNVFDLLAVNGCVMHISPVNNYVDHGFCQFSPTLFHDYYAANRFAIVDCKLFQHSRTELNAPYRMIDYSPGSLDAVSFGGLDSGMYGLLVLARKNADTTWNAIPQQSYYTRQGAWHSGRASE